uniref:Corticotropin-releasing factor domain-containing protein n=1 Tax=Gopherus agassizii TaxID=38772 RepID=A0A452ISS7_9SAUR
ASRIWVLAKSPLSLVTSLDSGLIPSAKRTLSLLPSLSHKKAMIVQKSSPGTKFSLSLDVPTHILKILIDLAKAKQMRAKAAANAKLMARIGRKK